MNEILLNIAHAVRPVCNFFLYSAAAVLTPVVCLALLFQATPVTVLSGIALALCVALARWMNG